MPPKRDIDRLIRKLPAFSPVVAELTALLEGNAPTNQAIAATLSRDAALAAKTLQLANSAEFARGREILDLEQAVGWVGMETLRDLAAAGAFASVLPDVLPGYRVSAAEFWRHNAATASFTVAIARHVGLPNPGSLFLAALLHDCGKLVSCSLLADQLEGIEARVAGGEDLVAAEAAVLGVDHGELGGLLAEQWSLPGLIVDVARHHHRPAEAPPEHAQGVAAVHVASAAAHAVGFGADWAGTARGVDDVAARMLGLDPADTHPVIARCVAGARNLAERGLVGAPG